MLKPIVAGGVPENDRASPARGSVSVTTAPVMLPVHLGLGAAARVDRVVVRWTSGAVDEAEALAVNQRVRFREGDGLVEGEPVGAEAVPERTRTALVVTPNPTAAGVTATFEAVAPGAATWRVVDALGRTVRAGDLALAPGENRLAWDGRGVGGAPVPPGVYVLVVHAPGTPPRSVRFTVLR